jgi:hypothetical protein
MFRQTVFPLCLLAALAFSPAAHAGDPAAPAQDTAARDTSSPIGPRAPDAGYDLAYDYVIAHDHVNVDPYYNYQGPPPTDPRAREQVGLRRGVLAITPLTGYYEGVQTYGGDGGYGYGYGSSGYSDESIDDDCGCAHYRRRYNVYVDDYGNRGDSYPAYDYHRHDDDGRRYDTR